MTGARQPRLAAANWAAIDVPTFPVAVDKRPCCVGGFKVATTDSAEHDRMFADPRAAYVAVPTGPVSGFDVLDIDPGKGGDEWLRANEHRLPPTRRQHTRSGGVHLFFRHAPGLRNSASRIAPGVDIRAEGGYVVDWESAGLYAEGSGWAEWPTDLLIEAIGRQRRETTAPAPSDLAPPSAAALISLLRATPNPEATTRDDWCALNLAVQGCLRALDALGAGDANDADDIRDAAADWCSRWESDRASDYESERNRWDSDWSLRTNDVSGWRHVLTLADRCGADVSEYSTATAVAEFGALPAVHVAEPVRSLEIPANDGRPVILDPSAPYEAAKALVERLYTLGAIRTLHRYGGEFWRWCGSHYGQAEGGEMRAAVYRFLDCAFRPARGGGHEPFSPNRSSVGDVLDALAALVQQPSTLRMPAWLATGDADRPAAADLIACRNGLLHVPTRRLLPHTPDLFNGHALGFSYQPDAPAPAEWTRFLGQLWPSDTESIAVLQELFGLLLTTDTKFQKLFLLIGPKRSGKGTIARVLTALVGDANTCAPTLAGLSTNFGLQPLIGKLLAMIGDARLSGRVDVHVIAERLLSISGEDSLTLDRKYLDAWTGKLPTRFLLMSNELPRLSDASGALASRFVLLQLRESFYQREDLGLTAKLLPELPAILNWSLAGLDRLRARGHFVQPASAQQAVAELEELASPISAFLAARCVIGADQRADCAALYGAWSAWCHTQGKTHPGSAALFSRDLHAAVAGLQTIRPRGECGTRQRQFQGVGLAAAEQVPSAANDPASLLALVG
jgi:putative DNA primase/helicase